jgi:CelD/BcsL family acetyltransferase involved in cellulose biosynthesis
MPPAKFAALWRNVSAFLQRDACFRHDVVDFRRMPATIGAWSNPFAQLCVLPHPSSAHLATLDADWGTLYRARRSAHARKQDRVKGKRLAEVGELWVASAREQSEIAAILQTLFAQKARTFRRKGIANTFEQPGHLAFLLDLATAPQTRDHVHVSALMAGDTPVAASLGFECADGYSLFLLSFDEAFARFSPGVIHVNALIERACINGFREFDFLVGEQRMKSGWCDVEIPLYDHVAAASWRGAIAAFRLRLFIRAKRTIKQNPRLWLGFQRLRALTPSPSLRR